MALVFTDAGSEPGQVTVTDTETGASITTNQDPDSLLIAAQNLNQES